MSKFTVTVDLESEKLKDAFMSFFINYKQQLSKYLNMTLESQGERSDTKILVQGDKVLVTQKTQDRGTVLQSFGIGLTTVGYDTLKEFDKYMVVQDGAVVVYCKAPDGIDQKVAQFPDLDTAIENINSTLIEEAVNRLKELFTPTQPTLVVNGEDSNENGDTEATV
jgi:hypothetical protein